VKQLFSLLVLAAFVFAVGCNDPVKTTSKKIDSTTPVKPMDKPMDKPADKPADKPMDKPADKPLDKPADKPLDKPADPKKPG